MTFLGAWWLALAAAVAVPLVLHLRRQPVTARLAFPAVRWLQRAQREHSRELRLRNLLVMLLRVAIVLAIAAAAARPVLRGLAGGHAPAALAIVLDNSLSSGRVVQGEPVLDRLRRAASAIVAAANADDRLWLVTADGRVTGGTPAQLAAALREVAPWPGAGDVAGAVAKPATLAATVPGRAARVAVLTDGQAAHWGQGAEAAGAGVTVYVPPLPPEAAGGAVLEAAPSPPRWSPRGRLRVRVAGADSVPVAVTLSGRTLARARAAPGSDTWIAASPVERGWVAGEVRGPPDAQRGDDGRHFAVWIGPAPTVRAAPAAGRFVRAALDALVADGRAAPGTEITVAPADEVGALPALLLPPADASRAPQANATLARLGVPWRFERIVEGAVPIDGAAWMRGARASTRWRLARTAAGDAAPTDTLARAGREPWVVAGDRWVVAASAFDTSATDVMLRAAFVPWFGELLAGRLAGDGGPVLPAAPGTIVTWPQPLDAIEHPDGTAEPVGARTLRVPDDPGVYFGLRRGARVGALVVNQEAEESDVSVLTAGEIAGRMRAGSARGVDDAAVAVRGAFGTEGGAALFGPVVLGALALLLVESLAARRGRDA